MLSDLVLGLSQAQRSMVTLIEREFAAAGLAPELAAAAVVNAVAESSLNPRAIDASGTCVGLFQLHEAGAGAGLSVTQRQDPAINTRRIIRTLQGSQGQPVLAAFAAGERNISRLAGLFCRHVERPARVDFAVAKREELARTLFPWDFVPSAAPVAPSAPPAPAAPAVSGEVATPSIAMRAVGLSESQRQMVGLIEQEFRAAGLPPVLAAAAVVNAYAESSLNPRAVGDSGASVGLFQLHERGAGAGMTVAERQDPTLNTRRILQVLMGAQGQPVLAALQAGERSVAVLAAMFSTHVERPLHKAAEEARRVALAARLFPGVVFEQLPAAVKAGASVAPLFFLAVGLGGAFLALKTLR